MLPTILIIDDEDHMRWVVNKALTKENYRIIEAPDGETGLKIVAAETPDLVLLDLRMPGMDGISVLKQIKHDFPKIPVIVITAHGTIETAIESMKQGASDYITKPFDIDELMIIIKRSIEVKDLFEEVSYLRSQLDSKMNSQLIGESMIISQVKDLISRVADSDATVLITGESGTGKEVVARSIHQQSGRKNKPLVVVNCAAIPESLLESELFGHEKGAFTGADAKKIGKFEAAHQGTILLDEIGEMPMAMQAKLLRVLQEKTFERVGGNNPIKVDVRILAATNKNIQNAIRQGEFREDLYYRLQVIPVNMPPLRERKEDIPLLVDYFLQKHDTNRRIQEISPEGKKVLQAYNWPGNIRELENIIERAIILCLGAIITPELLPLNSLQESANSGGLFNFPDDGIVLEDVEKQLILTALNKAGGNQTKAAQLLGITRSALIYRMQKYEI